MQHHYVIMFDDEVNKWVHATDIEGDRFDCHTAYNPTTNMWEHPYLGDGVYIPNEEELCAKVYLMIDQLNKETR